MGHASAGGRRLDVTIGERVDDLLRPLGDGSDLWVAAVIEVHADIRVGAAEDETDPVVVKPGEATIRDLAELTGAEVGTIRNKISELRGEGRVIDAGYRGREKLYTLPDQTENGPDFVTRERGQDGEQPQEFRTALE